MYFFLLVIVLPVLLFTAPGYPFGIFWWLYCLSFYLRFLVIPLVSFGDCIVSPSIYGSWLSLWYLLVIVLSVLLFTAPGYPLGIFWWLYCLSFYLRLLVIPLVSFGDCIVSPSIYGSWLSLWYLLVIVLSVLLFTVPGYPLGIFWWLYCLSFYLRLLVITLVSFGDCIVCPSIYGSWLSPWYLLVIVLSVLLFTVPGYPLGIFWWLYCLSFYLRLLVIPLVSFGDCIVCRSIYGSWLSLWYLLVIVLSVLLFTVPGYPLGIFWWLYCLSFYLRLLVIPLVSFGDCIVCRSIYGSWLSPWYLLVIVLSVLLFTVPGYPLGIFWWLYCLSFYLRLLVIPLVSFGDCIVCPAIYGSWLSLWYLLVIVLSVLLFTVPGYPLGIFWWLYCLSFYLRLLVIPLVSFGDCIVCPSIYGSWLSLWYLLVIVLSVLLFTAPGYPFGIFWWLYCLSFYLRLLFIPLVSFGDCIVCPSIYGSWLSLWYLLVIVLSVLLFTAPCYPFGIFKLSLLMSKIKIK